MTLAGRDRDAEKPLKNSDERRVEHLGESERRRPGSVGCPGNSHPAGAAYRPSAPRLPRPRSRSSEGPSFEPGVGP